MCVCLYVMVDIDVNPCVLAGEDLVPKSSRQVEETSWSWDGETEAGSEDCHVTSRSVIPARQRYQCRRYTVPSSCGVSTVASQHLAHSSRNVYSALSTSLSSLSVVFISAAATISLTSRTSAYVRTAQRFPLLINFCAIIRYVYSWSKPCQLYYVPCSWTAA